MLTVWGGGIKVRTANEHGAANPCDCIQQVVPGAGLEPARYL